MNTRHLGPKPANHLFNHLLYLIFQRILCAYFAIFHYKNSKCTTRGTTKTKALIIIILVLAIIAPAHAEYKFAENWTWTDTAYQSAFVAVAVADWAQTMNIAKNPDKYFEYNPILGRHPSQSSVNIYFPAAIIAHTVVSAALPPKIKIFGYDVPARRVWQLVWIGAEAGTVIHNFSIGIQVDF